MKRDIRQIFFSYTASWWVCAAAIALALIGFIAIAVYWNTAPSREVPPAMQAGQRIVIDVAKGTVEGAMRPLPELPVEVPQPTENAAPDNNPPPANVPHELPSANTANPPPADTANPPPADTANPPPAEGIPTETPATEIIPPANGVTPPAESAMPNAVPETPPAAVEAPAKPDPENMPASRIPPRAKPDVIASDLPPITDVAPTANALPAAPNKELVEKVDDGELPVISKEGLLPAAAYAKPYNAASKTPFIALLIVGLGQDANATNAAIALPDAISLSFSPYARELPRWAQNARNTGHEIYADLAAQTVDYPSQDPGPLALLADAKPEENKARLLTLLSQFTGYSGVVMPPNENYSQRREVIEATAKQIAGRGLYLLCGDGSAGTARAIAAKAAKGACADRIIGMRGDAVDAQLLALENTAKERGYVFAIVQPTPEALGQLAKWSTDLSKRGIALAPVSAAVGRQP